MIIIMADNSSPGFGEHGAQPSGRKHFGISKKYFMIFLAAAIFASKILFIKKIYKGFLKITFIISLIILMFLYFTSKHNSFFKYFYYREENELILILKIETWNTHRGHTIDSFNNNRKVTTRISHFFRSIWSINLKQIFYVFIMILFTCLCIAYIVITICYYIDSVISTIISVNIHKYVFRL